MNRPGDAGVDVVSVLHRPREEEEAPAGAVLVPAVRYWQALDLRHAEGALELAARAERG